MKLCQGFRSSDGGRGEWKTAKLIQPGEGHLTLLLTIRIIHLKPLELVFLSIYHPEPDMGIMVPDFTQINLIGQSIPSESASISGRYGLSTEFRQIVR